METNEQTLKSIGIQLLEPLKLVKSHHKMKCMTCSYEWIATPISKIQNYKKYQTNGCPSCLIKLKYQTNRNEALEKIEERNFTLLSDYNGNQQQNVKIKVRNNICNHEFEVLPKNLITRNVNCPICNKAEKIKRLNANSKARSVEWHKTADIWDQYRHKVYMATRSTYRKFSNIINPLNLPRGLAGQEGAYHLDHIVPVRYCFEHYIPVEVCAHYTNLQMLHWNDNIGSRDNLKEGIEIPPIFKPYI